MLSNILEFDLFHQFSANLTTNKGFGVVFCLNKLLIKAVCDQGREFLNQDLLFGDTIRGSFQTANL